jgi:putative spermidine/putrescine transport system ATP-binding protein
MADRIAVMSRGNIEQVSTPTEIYDRPQTLFVNQFVGTTNVLSGEFFNGPPTQIRLAGDAAIDVAAKPGFTNGSKVVVSIRPEQLHVVANGGLPGTVRAVMPLGTHVVYEVEITAGTLLKVSESREGRTTMRQTGEEVHIVPTSPDACHVFPAAGSPEGVLS